MPKIFISYRRGDSAGHAGRLFDHLSRDFSRERVFMDVVGIQPGMDFTEAIDHAVGACDVLLVVIGPDWAHCTDTHGRRRLEDPNDFVAIETATALKRQVRVIPVLVQGASLPLEAELPDGLKPLLRRNAYEIRDTRWESDVRALSEALSHIDRARRVGSGRPSPRVVKWASGVVVVAGMASAGWVFTRPAAKPATTVQSNQPEPNPVPVPKPDDPGTGGTSNEPDRSPRLSEPNPVPVPKPDDASTGGKTSRLVERPTPAPSQRAARCKPIAGRALYGFDLRPPDPWRPLAGSEAAEIRLGRDGCDGSGALAFVVPALARDAGAGVFVEPQDGRGDWTGNSRLRISLRTPGAAPAYAKLQVYALANEYRCTCYWMRDPPDDSGWHEVQLKLNRSDCRAKEGGQCSPDLANINQIGIKLFGTTATTTVYIDQISLD